MSRTIAAKSLALKLVLLLPSLALVGCSPKNEQSEAFGVSRSGAVVDAGPMPIEPSGISVKADTVLNVGDKVQVQWKGPLKLANGKSTNESWWNGEVLACNPDGTVKIHYTGWRAEWDESVERAGLRIPPE